MLWTCVCLPALALDILDRGSTDEIPVVVQDGRGQRVRVHSVNAQARTLGIQPGMAINAACALVPTLRVFDRDEATEYQTLKSIAAWAWKYSPRVSLHPPAAVLLDIGGNQRLFRNLRRQPEQFQSDLEDLGYRSVIATAPTPLAALLLAVSGHPVSWIRDRDALPLPLSPSWPFSPGVGQRHPSAPPSPSLVFFHRRASPSFCRGLPAQGSF